MRRLAAVLLAALAAGCGAPEGPGEVRVFAASSLTDVLKTIAAEFEQSTGTKVKLNLASSSVLAKQIVEGARCDVFLSADQEWADFVEKRELLEPGTRRDQLTNDLVLVFPKNRDPVMPNGVSGVSDPSKEPERARRLAIQSELTAPSVRRVAMGDPLHVPAGKYAKRVFVNWGFWEQIKGKVVACENVRAALALVERGEVEAGIVYRTDAAASDRVRQGLWLLEGIEYPKFNTSTFVAGRLPNPANPIRYPVLGVKGVGVAGRAFLEFLGKERAMEVFRAAGFGVPSPPK